MTRVCIHLLTGQKIPSALFVSKEGEANHYCPACLTEVVADVLETMRPEDISESIVFSHCDHAPADNVCDLCVQATMAMLTYSNAVAKLKKGPSKLTNKHDQVIMLLTHKYGRIAPRPQGSPSRRVRA